MDSVPGFEINLYDHDYSLFPTLYLVFLYLVGPQSGNAKKVAEYVPGSGMESLRAQSDTAAGAISKAKLVSKFI